MQVPGVNRLSEALHHRVGHRGRMGVAGKPETVVRPSRFEREACGLEVRCSIQLSYGDSKN